MKNRFYPVYTCVTSNHRGVSKLFLILDDSQVLIAIEDSAEAAEKLRVELDDALARSYDPGLAGER